ncbi:aconitase family protein [Pseudomonas sp. 148P]|uniref:Aconitase family protein n=1 Tax=Pseudomonas ulcerans TaxID=3115852 RepID=A0ABU7HXN7_9PSED|nr:MULTISPECIES: aconitase family protein [unclassified Pseudomonas]MEE1922132.1 aconitase family protein [Pseudomonas sp. 147P]MEE1936317.1 aconitase family protein [Pseudomonas sp. 148P]
MTTRKIQFAGRFLFLSCSSEAVTAQLEGRDLELSDALPLRDNISTDEITPVVVMMTYDSRLGAYPYVGFKTEGELPIGNDAVKNGSFEITVAGKRYGKGSSRESSPLAEKSAGIRLIIAESFERIYRQNCDNIGIYTSTDFSLIERIRSGEAIDLEEFLVGRDAVTQEVIRAGGLLAYSKLHLPRQPQKVFNPLPTHRPLTLVEKIIERRRVAPAGEVARGDGLFLSADWRFSHDYFTGMCAHFMHEAFGENLELARPHEIIAFQDHLILANQSYPHIRDNLLAAVGGLASAHDDFVRRYPVVAHGALKGESGSEGICHALMTELHALPGQVVVGTDSHSPHSGALGCLAFGAGATDIANSWATGFIRCRMPEIIKVELAGRLRADVTAKDIVLELLRSEPIRQGQAIGAVFEYCGEAVRALSVDERATLTNMVAELGGFTGIVAPDQKVVDFLRERRGIEVELEDWLFSDADADYKEHLVIDCSSLSPLVAAPGDPGNGVALEELETPVSVDIAYGGSCTAGKREDFDYYHEVLAWGLERGMKVADHTRLYLQFGTLAVRDYCREQGYLATFEQAGVELIMPGCGACANCGPGSSTRAEQVTISAINRNFPGRSGPGQVWLGSPYTVAASALLGRLASFAELQAEVA